VALWLVRQCPHTYVKSSNLTSSLYWSSSCVDEPSASYNEPDAKSYFLITLRPSPLEPLAVTPIHGFYLCSDIAFARHSHLGLWHNLVICSSFEKKSYSELQDVVECHGDHRLLWLLVRVSARIRTPSEHCAHAHLLRHEEVQTNRGCVDSG
jgi:hypothetical protein